MEQENPGPGQSVKDRFPRMRPVKEAPSLFAINGCGFSMLGRRDYDAVTGTYVKTRCICLLFIPLYVLGAYRVSDADDGDWNFIGEEPLSKLAGGWNWCVAAVLAALMIGLGVDSYTSSPNYKARQALKLAQADLQAGQLLKAVAAFKKLSFDAVVVREGAKQGLKAALEAALQSESPEVVAGGIRALNGIGGHLDKPVPLIPEGKKRALGLVEKFGAKDPELGLKLMAEVVALDPKDESFAKMRFEWLKRTVAAKPGNIDRLVELALIYEGEKNLEDCRKILMPQREKLGSTEGARILGRQLMQEGDYLDSYALLFPYTQARLEELHNIERSYTNAIETVNRRAISDLKQGRAGKNFYDAYDRASKADRENMVDSYIRQRMEQDGMYLRAVEALKGANKIVDVALDLGIVQLNRAQDLREPAARKAELEAAEKTFLAIRGFAGDSDEYRLFLGQVYYWLGRSGEGRALFDQLLTAKKRSAGIMLALAKTLRDVGEQGQARDLAEEAYGSATDLKTRHGAAALRARLQKDVDDQILWLRRSDADDVNTKITLNAALGHKAQESGNRKQAAEYLRAAIAGYEALPKDATTLNNCGLDCFALFEASGDFQDHDRGLRMMEEAVALEPSGSILLINYTHVLLSRAVMDVVKDEFLLNQLRQEAGLSMLSHLYADEAGRERVFQRLRDSESMKKFLTCLDKAMLLAPKDQALYETSLRLLAPARNLAELQKLQQRLRVAQLDFAEDWNESLKIYAGAKEQESLAKTKNQIQKMEGLLKNPEVQNHPATRYYLQVNLAALKQGLGNFGQDVDLKPLLKEAEAAHAARPSSASHGLLAATLFGAGHAELKAQSPEYAKLAEQTRRALGPRYLIALLLEQNGPLAALLRANPHVQRALVLEKESGRQFASQPSSEHWAMFLHTDAPAAAEVVNAFKGSEAARLADEMQYELNPSSAGQILERYWLYRLLGEQQKAMELYQAAQKRGVPLPVL